MGPRSVNAAAGLTDVLLLFDEAYDVLDERVRLRYCGLTHIQLLGLVREVAHETARNQLH